MDSLKMISLLTEAGGLEMTQKLGSRQMLFRFRPKTATLGLASIKSQRNQDAEGLFLWAKVQNPKTLAENKEYLVVKM